MLIVIDGYNLLKQVLRETMISEFRREQFIKQLSAYAAKKSHKIIVVFDAGPFSRSTKERMHGIYVVYSGTRETADDYIRDYVEAHKSEDLLLVTSDRELRRHAAARSVESIESIQFYAMVQEAIKKQAAQKGLTVQTIKTSQDADHELDALMSTMDFVPQKREDVLPNKSRESDGQQLSKKERHLLKKIKKL